MRSRSLSEKSSSTDRFVLLLLFLSYVAFSVAFFLENILGPYSSLFSIDNSVVSARVLFIGISLLCVFLFFKRRAPIARLFVLVFTLFYSALGILGYVVNAHQEVSVFIAHFSVYVQFGLLVFAASLLGLCDDDFIVRSIRRFSYGFIFINIVFLIILFIFVDVGLYISASLYSIGFALSYFLSSRSRHSLGLLQVLLVALFSLKRGLLVATILHFFLVGKFSFRNVVFFLIAVLILFFGVYAIYQVFPDAFFSKLIDANVSRSIESGGSLDSVSSGRVSIMTAVLHELSSIYNFVFGAGFGVVFNAYGFLEGRTSEWLTSGVDVILGHFWLIHGVVFGTILFVVVSCSIFYLFLTRYYKSDLIFAFFANLLAFNYLVSLTSFTPWDPVWGLAVGLLLARYRVLRRREYRLMTLDESLAQE
jgi:hypothetical protein